MINTSDADIATAFISDSSASAVVTWKPMVSQILKQKGVASLFNSSQIPGEILDLSLSSDERWLATASADNTARLWDVATGQELLVLRGHASEVTTVALLSDGPGLRVLTGSNDKTAKVWAVTGLDRQPIGKELLALKGHTRGLTSVAFAPDGRAALTAAHDGLTILWPAALPAVP